MGSNIPVEKYREKMPYTCDPDQAFNIWEIVKDMIGKDLAHFAVPGKKDIWTFWVIL